MFTQIVFIASKLVRPATGSAHRQGTSMMPFSSLEKSITCMFSSQDEEPLQLRCQSLTALFGWRREPLQRMEGAGNKPQCLLRRIKEKLVALDAMPAERDRVTHSQPAIAEEEN